MAEIRVDIAGLPIQERFEHLLKLIGSERFLKKQGLGNEVPFFICPFNPREAVDMERIRNQLRNQLEHQGIQVLDINLYDLAIKLLKERDIWDRLLEMEREIAKDQLKELLQGVLDSEAHLVPAIAEEMGKCSFDVMFISGIGEVFPYIRSHNVLNNLQSTAKDKPTVLFFPGEYTHSLEDGASLDLFGRLHDDKYYRAFNIYHCEI
ncbi:MAG: DUF1788 domain-containing protein [Desulfoprunum sp.]|jgi:hypothetical protein